MKFVMIGGSNLFYQGRNLFDDYMKSLDSLGTPGAVEDEGQEVYLGFIPNKNIFITGYDMWYHDEDGMYSAFIFFKLNNGIATQVDYEEFYDGGIYPVGLRYIESKFPTLVNIRLD